MADEILTRECYLRKQGWVEVSDDQWVQRGSGVGTRSIYDTDTAVEMAQRRIDNLIDDFNGDRLTLSSTLITRPIPVDDALVVGYIGMGCED